MTDFSIGETTWVNKLGNLRNTIRQELIARQLGEHIGNRTTVVDVGCGQGTQAIRLLQSGCTVVGVEPSESLAERFAADSAGRSLIADVRVGGIADLDRLLGEEVFDVVCAHGLLMYLDDSSRAIATLARRVASNGLLSLTFKNAHGLAMRPALRGDWVGAVAAFDDDVYLNELGVTARAHRFEDVERCLEAAGLCVEHWYGVRVFNDAIAGDVAPPADAVLEQIIDAEERAGRTDPYRWLGSQIHVLATRVASS